MPHTNAIIYTSQRHLKTIATVCHREWRKHHPLPKLQSALSRTIKDLLKIASSKRRQCKTLPLSKNENIQLKIHIIARRAIKHLDPDLRRRLQQLKISDEDREVIAIAILSQKHTQNNQVLLITTDKPLLQTTEQLKQELNLKIKPTTPSHYLTNLPTQQT